MKKQVKYLDELLTTDFTFKQHMKENEASTQAILEI